MGAALLLAGAGTAAAQGAGVRGGLSVNPDQAYLGAHFETSALVDRLHFRPNLEVGFGNDVTTTAVNLEFVYKWPQKRSPWTFYAGAGPSVIVYHVEDHTDLRAVNLPGASRTTKASSSRRRPGRSTARISRSAWGIRSRCSLSC
jgi:hypothetical protein